MGISGLSQEANFLDMGGKKRKKYMESLNQAKLCTESEAASIGFLVLVSIF